MLKESADSMIEILKDLFNRILDEEKIPTDQTNTLVIVIYKQDDALNLEKDTTMNLLSQVYKLFRQVIKADELLSQTPTGQRTRQGSEKNLTQYNTYRQSES